MATGRHQQNEHEQHQALLVAGSQDNLGGLVEVVQSLGLWNSRRSGRHVQHVAAEVGHLELLGYPLRQNFGLELLSINNLAGVAYCLVVQLVLCETNHIVAQL